jgi:hypothetical protein
MALISLPTEIRHQLVKEFNVEAKLALAATNHYLRLLVLEKHDIKNLVKNAFQNLEHRSRSRVSSSNSGWMRMSYGSLPCYTCLKILPPLHYRLGDMSYHNAGTRLCMTCRCHGNIAGPTRSFRFDDEPWLYCAECKIIVHGPGSSPRVLRGSCFPGTENVCYKCLARNDGKPDTDSGGARVEKEGKGGTEPSQKRRKL